MANTLKFGNGQWATGNGTALAYNDENSNFKPLPFDFTRASSGTTVNQSGLIETVGSGIPRIDFQGNTKGALLLEPSRTNFVLLSNDFSALSGGFVTPNYGTSPEGLSVSRVLFTGANQLISDSTSLATGVVCNFSAYVKGVKGEFIKFAAGGVDIAHTFSGEWERLSGSATSINNTWNLNTYGGATARDFQLCGAQLEAGSYATSYIPTSGSAVTRVAESCSQTTPSGVIGQTEGTLYAEIDFKSKPENGSPIVGIMTLNNNVTNLQNCIILGIERQSGGINRFYPLVQVGNSDVAFIIGGTLTDGNYKAAFAYKQNDFVLYVNGVQIGTDSSGAVPTTSQVLVGERFNTDTYKIADGIKDTKLYNTRLSNSELAALTQV